MAKLAYASCLLTLVALCGCKSGPVQHVKDVAVQVPNGWTLVKNDVQGISLCAPAGWKEGSGLTTGVSQMMSDNGMGMDGMNQDNPMGRVMGEISQVDRLEEAKALKKLADDGKFCHCIDGSKGIIGEQRTRFYVQKLVPGGNANMEAAAEKEKSNMKGLDNGTAKKVDLPIGPAIRLENKITTIGGDEVYRIAFVTVDGPNVYILRFVTTGNGQVIQSIADYVAQTLRIKPSA